MLPEFTRSFVTEGLGKSPPSVISPSVESAKVLQLHMKLTETPENNFNIGYNLLLSKSYF